MKYTWPPGGAQASLAQWLAWQEALHPQKIDLSLERIRCVAERMALLSAPYPIITVAGTNGKGSTVALLDAIYRAAGWRVGLYTSPHLLRYNERVRLNGIPVSDAQLCEAFIAINTARQEISLSYFEFATLAALWIFQRAGLDVVILEVGLGGRLDAVNLLDADVAVLTTVALDHEHFLGRGREAIGREKAGIFRPLRPVVCGEADPPASVLAWADALKAPLYLRQRDFHAQPLADGRWIFHGPQGERGPLPRPALRGTFQYANAAASVMAVGLLQARLPVGAAALAQGLAQVTLAGRFERLRGDPEVIIDVAHNPQAAEALAGLLREYPGRGRTLAVMAMMADKDIDGVLHALHPCMDAWYLGDLTLERALPAQQFAQYLGATGVTEIYCHNTLLKAYQQALSDARPADRIVVTGSFYTVAEILAGAPDGARQTPIQT